MFKDEEYSIIKNKIEYQFNYEQDLNNIKGSKNLKEFNNILNSIKSKNKLKILKINKIKIKNNDIILNQNNPLSENLIYKELSNKKIISLRLQQIKESINSKDKIYIKKLLLSIKNWYNFTNLEIDKELFRNLQYDEKIKNLENDLKIRKVQISKNDYLANFQNIYFKPDEIKILNFFVKNDNYKNKFKTNQIYKKVNFFNKKKEVLNKNFIKNRDIKNKLLEEHINDKILINKYIKEIQNLKDIYYNESQNKKYYIKVNNMSNIFKILLDVYNFSKDEKQIQNLDNLPGRSSIKIDKNHKDFSKFNNLLNVTSKSLNKMLNKYSNKKKSNNLAFNRTSLYNISNNSFNKKYKNNKFSYNNIDINKSLKLINDDNINITNITNSILKFYNGLLVKEKILKKNYENILFKKNNKYLRLISLNKQLESLTNLKLEKNKKIINYKSTLNQKTSYTNIEKYFLNHNKININIFNTVNSLTYMISKFSKIFNQIFSIENLKFDENLLNIIRNINLILKENLSYIKNDNKYFNLDIINKYFYGKDLYGLKLFWRHFFKSNIKIFCFIKDSFIERILINFWNKEKNIIYGNEIKLKKSFSQIIILNKNCKSFNNLIKLQTKEVFNKFINYLLIEFMHDLNFKIDIWFNNLINLLKNLKYFIDGKYKYKPIFIHDSKKIISNNLNSNSLNPGNSKNNFKFKKNSRINNFKFNINPNDSINISKSKKSNIIFKHKNSLDIYNYKDGNNYDSNNSNYFNNSSSVSLKKSCNKFNISKFKNQIIRQSVNYSKLKLLIKNNNKNNKKNNFKKGWNLKK